MAWHLADGEDTESWLTFLSQLEEQGLRGENGLELIIHDGGSGLCAALTTIHFDAPEQRCLFHKLRNIWQAIRVADDLPLAERKRQRRAIYRDFVAIFQAKQRSTVLRRALKVVQQYRTTQPEAVATLRRDFAPRSPTSCSRNTTRPGAAATCAPPVASNASIATCGAVSAAPTPTTPIRRLGDDRPGGGSHRPAAIPVQTIDELSTESDTLTGREQLSLRSHSRQVGLRATGVSSSQIVSTGGHAAGGNAVCLKLRRPPRLGP